MRNPAPLGIHKSKISPIVDMTGTVSAISGMLRHFRYAPSFRMKGNEMRNPTL